MGSGDNEDFTRDSQNISRGSNDKKLERKASRA